MKKIWGYVAALLMVAGVATLSSCRGQSDEMDVPDGVLRIFADKTTIAADGSDLVTFTIMLGKEDVSQQRTMQLVRNGKLCNYGVNSFSTNVAGEYTFTAEYYYEGTRYYSDNSVVVYAQSTSVDGEKEKYAQQILGFQFTSIGCTACPFLASSIKQVQADYPGRLAVVSFHQDFNYADEMTHPMTATYYNYICKGLSGLPQFNANMIADKEYITVSDKDQMVAILDRVEKNYPATCGVAIESEWDSASRKVTVKSKITSNTPSKYRYQIFLVEDNFVSYQYGIEGSEAANYKHNNVVRVVSSNDRPYGAEFNDGMNMQVGVEAVATTTLEIPRVCTVENMRVVVAAFSSYDGGNSYVVNNCAHCPVGGSVDYVVK